jgi:RNA polymerase sigma factor (TIGR02999 family)
MNEATQLLKAAAQGDPQAASQLLPLVYDELRRLAASRLAHEKAGQTLDATALVHEAYLRLVGGEERHWEGRGHFLAAAAEAMRRILIDNARRKQRPRHGGDRQRVAVDLDRVAAETPEVDLLALDEALAGLAREAPERAELVKLRYFLGLTMPEAAGVLGVSLATAERYWTYARTWLYAELSDPPERPDSGEKNAPAEGVEGESSP